MTASLSPVVFNAPLVNPAPTGLFSAVQWAEDSEPLRWLGPGVDVRVWNYGHDELFGVWELSPFALTEDINDAKIPGGHGEPPDTFRHFTAWASDYCDLTAQSRAEVDTRAAQALRLKEQPSVETTVAERLLTDAGTPVTSSSLVGALGALEAALAGTGTLGVIHASATQAAVAASQNLIRWSGGKMLTPLGHQWVFGGGYVTELGDTLVATSPLFGWRGQVSVRSAIKTEWNRYYAIAERSLLIGYEAVVGAATIDTP
ncbi:hypothetical protein [Mycobacterium phage PR]|nr:hypothetical protein [Mycobacterium phage D12]BBC28624.1 hypothetical protein [Mycobacterium phage PR]